MQIVINISEENYELAKRVCQDYVYPSYSCDAIAAGVILPEHGRLIDADELKKNAYSASAFTQVVDVFDIDNAPTILGGVRNEC